MRTFPSLEWLYQAAAEADMLMRAAVLPEAQGIWAEEGELLLQAPFDAPNVARWSPRRHRADAAELMRVSLWKGLLTPDVTETRMVRDLCTALAPAIGMQNSTTTKPDGVRRNVTWLLWIVPKCDARELCMDGRPDAHKRWELVADWWLATQRLLADPNNDDLFDRARVACAAHWRAQRMTE